MFHSQFDFDTVHNTYSKKTPFLKTIVFKDF